MKAAGSNFLDAWFDGSSRLTFSKIFDARNVFRGILRWLAPNGRLVTSFRTVRSLPVVEGLLVGRWLGGAEAGRGRRLRYYTRREIEKLLVPNGFLRRSCGERCRPGTYGMGSAQGRPDLSRWAGSIRGASRGRTSRNSISVGSSCRPPAPTGPKLASRRSYRDLQPVEYTQQCVREHPARPMSRTSLISSTTARPTEQSHTWNRRRGATVIRNQVNRGFPAAANQGIAAATGDQVLLLNNDTIVTTGWLGGMIATLESDPKIGLVGPMLKLRGQRAASRGQL